MRRKSKTTVQVLEISSKVTNKRFCYSRGVLVAQVSLLRWVELFHSFEFCFLFMAST